MADKDLESMSLEELKALQKSIDKAMKDVEARRRQDALSAVQATAREHGFELSELLGESSGGRRKAFAPSVPRYQHPENPEVTWSGRGRRPAWVTAALESGKSLEDLAI